MKNKKTILAVVCCGLLGFGGGAITNMAVSDLLYVGSGKRVVAITPDAITWFTDGDVQFQLMCTDGELHLVSGEGETLARWKP